MTTPEAPPPSRFHSNHERLLALVTPRVRRALVAAVPGAKLQTLRPLGEGWGSAAYQFQGSTGSRWVLRLPRPRTHWATGDLEKEVRFLPALAGAPFEIAVPRDARLLTDGRGRTLGAIHRLVPGTPLGEVTAPRGRARAALLADIARALSTLHAIAAVEARRRGIEEIDLWQGRYLERIEQTRRLVADRTREWLDGKIEEYRGWGGSEAAARVLIHGDLSGDHLLVDCGGRLSGLIDFADVVIADPALDLAGVGNQLGWPDVEAILEAYTGPVDQHLLERARFYLDIAPIYSITDGAIGVGPEAVRQGIRRLAARAAADTRGDDGN